MKAKCRAKALNQNYGSTLSKLGTDNTLYKTKRQFIDTTLLARRNSIAHEENLDLGVDDYLKARDEI